MVCFTNPTTLSEIIPHESTSTLSPKCWLPDGTARFQIVCIAGKKCDLHWFGVDWAAGRPRRPPHPVIRQRREADAAILLEVYICTEAYHPPGTPIVAIRALLSVVPLHFLEQPIGLFLRTRVGHEASR